MTEVEMQSVPILEPSTPAKAEGVVSPEGSSESRDAADGSDQSPSQVYIRVVDRKRSLSSNNEEDVKKLLKETQEKLDAQLKINEELRSEVERLQKQVGLKAGSTAELHSAETLLSEGYQKYLDLLAEARKQLPEEALSPVIEVRLQSVIYQVNVAGGTQTSRIPTVWSSFKRLAFGWKPKRIFSQIILNRVSGVFKPGTLTLILGPPGCGKTSLLKTIAGRITPNQGTVYFNNHNAQDLIVPNLVGYVGQIDQHIPLLTVRETLEFAQQCTAPLPPADAPALKKIQDINTDVILKVLGLDRVANTIIGNEFIRGVSGGQKKRVTLGEMMMSSKSVLCLDEISTGLDAVTTIEIVRAIQSYAKIFKQTVIMSLLQPPPEVVNMFDDILLLSHGRIVYHGPREQVVEYFNELGFQIPFSKDRADFLQEVTVEGRQYVRAGETAAPLTSSEFASRWKRSTLCQEMAAQVKRRQAPESRDALLRYLKDNRDRKEYARTFWDHQVMVTKRQLELTKRNKMYFKIRVFQMILMGFLVGTLFFQMSFDAYELRYGVIYYAILFLALGNMSTTINVMKEREIFYKQQAANFFRGANWAIAQLFAHIPIALFESVFMGIILYWMTGLAPEASRFFFFVFMLFILCVSLTQFFRALASSMSSINIAQPLTIFLLVLSILFAGFLITEDHINDGWIWVYWINPVSWALRSMMLNEFKAEKFNIPGDCEDGLTQGECYLRAFGMRIEESWRWYGVIYTLAFFGISLLWQCIALIYIRYDVQNIRTNGTKDEEEDPFESKESEQHKPIKISPGSTLPIHPMTLVFQNISYAVDLPRERARLDLLIKVSGVAKPGRMTALMGESGAGKTTLLDVLAGRKTDGYITGETYINGHLLNPKKYRRIVGYVEQTDIHSATATVREALMFSANLRLAGVTKEQRVDFVSEVLEILELTPLQDSLVGRPGAGLSLEQRKRLTIGVELVANPAIIFLDEPTSGLDSRAAQIVMRVLRNIAQTGRTIICTIHQPSAEIFSLFDDLLLLQRGGKVVFFGELGDGAKNLVEYLESYSSTKKIGAGVNPANWMLEVINDSKSGYTQGYSESKLYKQLTDDIATLRATEEKELHIPKSFATPLSIQLKVLCRRFIVHYWRTPSYNFTRLVILLLIGLLFGTVFYKLDDTTTSGIHSKLALIYITNIFCGVINLQSVQGVAAEELAVYHRERASKSYSVNPYAVAMAVAEIPYLIITSLLFLSIMYFMVGFNASAEAFFTYWLLFSAFTSMMTFYGQFLATIFANQMTANLLGSTFLSIWNLFSGFLITKPSIPDYWIWLFWLSPSNFALNAMGSLQYYCDYNAPGNTCRTGDFIQRDGTRSVEPIWKFVHEFFGFDHTRIWIDFAVLIGFIIAFRVGTYLALKYVKHIRR